MITRRLVLLRYWKSVIFVIEGFAMADAVHASRANVGASDSFSISDAAAHS